jgi:hypothetical protein
MRIAFCGAGSHVGPRASQEPTSLAAGRRTIRRFRHHGKDARIPTSAAHPARDMLVHPIRLRTSTLFFLLVFALAPRTAADLRFVDLDPGRVTATLQRVVPVTTGEVRSFRWRTVQGALVPVELTKGDELIAVEWRAVDDKWPWPSECVFERIFAGWDAEVLEIQKVTIESAGR